MYRRPVSDSEAPPRARWLWPLVWAISIYLTSSAFISNVQLAQTVKTVSAGHVEATAFENFWKFTWWIFVKGWHATEFGILAWFCSRAWKARHAWWSIPCAYAVADEFHQLFVRYRGGRFSDVLIDWLGVLAFAAFAGKIRLSKLGWGVGVVVWLLLLMALSYFPFGMPRLGGGASRFAP